MDINLLWIGSFCPDRLFSGLKADSLSILKRLRTWMSVNNVHQNVIICVLLFFITFILFVPFARAGCILKCLENHALIIQRPNDRKLQMEILVKPENKVFCPQHPEWFRCLSMRGRCCSFLSHRQRLTLTSSRWPDRRIQCKGKFTKTGRTVNISKWSPAALRK